MPEHSNQFVNVHVPRIHERPYEHMWAFECILFVQNVRMHWTIFTHSLPFQHNTELKYPTAWWLECSWYFFEHDPYRQWAALHMRPIRQTLTNGSECSHKRLHDHCTMGYTRVGREYARAFDTFVRVRLVTKMTTLVQSIVQWSCRCLGEHSDPFVNVRRIGIYSYIHK